MEVSGSKRTTLASSQTPPNRWRRSRRIQSAFLRPSHGEGLPFGADGRGHGPEDGPQRWAGPRHEGNGNRSGGPQQTAGGGVCGPFPTWMELSHPLHTRPLEKGWMLGMPVRPDHPWREGGWGGHRAEAGRILCLLCLRWWDPTPRAARPRCPGRRSRVVPPRAATEGGIGGVHTHLVWLGRPRPKGIQGIIIIRILQGRRIHDGREGGGGVPSSTGTGSHQPPASLPSVIADRPSEWWVWVRVWNMFPRDGFPFSGSGSGKKLWAGVGG